MAALAPGPDPSVHQNAGGALTSGLRRLSTVVLACLVPVISIFIVFHLLWGLLTVALLFPWLPTRGRNALIQFWSRGLLAAFGVSLREMPRLPPTRDGRGRLLVMNHVSWIDVFVVAAIEPVRFVAKSEIRSWPLAGWLAQGVGTVFIERGRRHAVGRVNEVVVQRLLAGQSVGIFPEGTTTDGSTLLRFHANLIQAGVDADAEFIPVALRYEQGGQRSTAAAFIGDVTLLQSMWRILVAPRLSCRVRFLAPMHVQGDGRHELALRARRAIAHDLGLDEWHESSQSSVDLEYLSSP